MYDYKKANARQRRESAITVLIFAVACSLMAGFLLTGLVVTLGWLIESPAKLVIVMGLGAILSFPVLWKVFKSN